MINTISASELEKKRKSKDANFLLIDVREPFERESGHIEGDINTPLSTVNYNNLPDGYNEIIIYCRSGSRSYTACEKLFQENKKLKLFNLEGGFLSYSEAIKEKKTACTIHKRSTLSLEQQTYITIGTILSLSTMLGITLSTIFYVIPFLMGLGLIFADYRGDCMLTKIISKMPWNQRS